MVFCQDLTHVGLSAHAQKKGHICKRLKFTMVVASIWQCTYFLTLVANTIASVLVQG